LSRRLPICSNELIAVLPLKAHEAAGLSDVVVENCPTRNGAVENVAVRPPGGPALS
jgi:hypothetical protein